MLLPGSGTLLDRVRAPLDRESLDAALSTAGMVIWDVDLATGWVRRAGATVGRAEERLEDFFERVVDEDRDRVRQALDEALAGRSEYRIEYRLRTPTGDARWVTSQGRVIAGEDGKAARVLGVSTDVNDRKRVELDLRASERARAAELEAVMDAVPAVVWIARDPACRYITGNRAASALLRLPPGRNNSLSAPEGERPTHFRAFRDGVELKPEELSMQLAASQGVEVRGVEQKFVFDDGTERDLIGNAAPLFDESGVVRGAVATFVDVTSLKAAETALRVADRRKNEFIALLAHELRNPLAALAGVVGLYRGGGATTADDLAWAYDTVDRQVKQLSRLVDDLLDISRMTLGKIQLHRERLEAASAVAHAVDTVRPQADARRHRLSVAYGPGPFPLDADPARLEQIVVNLIGNAVKYTEPGGQIAVRVTRDDHAAEVLISVRDNGVGIAAVLLPRVFDQFIQADVSAGRTRGGLGIGLTLVRSLVELHGGAVTAESAGPGQGSTFTVRLPLASGTATRPPDAPATLRREPAAPAPALATPRPTGGRVLVVDDNVDAARGLSRLLTLLGYEVDTVHDGPAALTAATARPPDVVLLDIGLPGMDGYEVASQLRTQHGLTDALIVVISGFGQDRDRDLAAAAGVDHHLLKPIAFSALRALLPSRSYRAPSAAAPVFQGEADGC